jgi:hypothetical protein
MLQTQVERIIKAGHKVSFHNEIELDQKRKLVMIKSKTILIS